MALSLVSNNKLNVADYEKWTAKDFDAYVQLKGSEKDANAVHKEGFQRTLMKVGIFEGSMRIPTIFRTEMEDYYPMGASKLPEMQYPITRVILNGNYSYTREDLIFSWDDRLFRLAFDGDTRYKYWRVLQPYVIQYGEQVLSYMPNIYLQIKQIASIENIARTTLLESLPVPLANLVLGYAGFPSHAVQRSAERMNGIRQNLYATFRPHAIKRKDIFTDPLEWDLIEQRERVSSMVVQYVGETDVDETATP